MIKKRYCPFVKNLYAECYCVKLDSQNVINTLDYCSKNFLACEIYSYLLSKQGLPTESNDE